MKENEFWINFTTQYMKLCTSKPYRRFQRGRIGAFPIFKTGGYFSDQNISSTKAGKAIICFGTSYLLLTNYFCILAYIGHC